MFENDLTIERLSIVTRYLYYVRFVELCKDGQPMYIQWCKCVFKSFL